MNLEQELIGLSEDKKNKAVAYWIFIGVAMLIIQVLLGGITRLTGSGLSITEWKPIMGALPPLNENQWQKAFEQYQQIAQYKYLNYKFTLSNFKFIFFWEWFHRLWARLIAVAFAIPFIYFLVKGYFKKEIIKPLLLLFVLGAMQGAIGWIMVKSGLNDENIYVSHIKLSIHFVSAMVLICFALIVGLQLISNSHQKIENSEIKNGIILLIVLVTIQLFYGAFMAGLKAANAAPTWPSINGSFLPNINDNIFMDRLAIHFIHRNLAYLIAIIIFWWTIKAKHTQQVLLFNKIKWLPLGFVFLQIFLGVMAIFASLKIRVGYFGVFETLALLHQLVGMLLLLALVAVGYYVKFNKR